MTAQLRAVRADAVGTEREMLGIAPKIDDVIFCCFFTFHNSRFKI